MEGNLLLSVDKKKEVANLGSEEIAKKHKNFASSNKKSFKLYQDLI